MEFTKMNFISIFTSLMIYDIIVLRKEMKWDYRDEIIQS